MAGWVVVFAVVLCSLVAVGSAKPATTDVALRQIEIRAAPHLVLKSRMAVQLRAVDLSGLPAIVTYGGTSRSVSPGGAVYETT